MNTIVQCNMGILDILNYDSDELMNHKSCVWLHPVNSYYSDFQMRQIVQGINSTQFLQKKVDGEEITSVKQHFQQHFEIVAQHFQQHFESVAQHFQQHFESVMQHFQQHLFMTLKMNIHILYNVCPILGSYKSVAQSVAQHFQQHFFMTLKMKIPQVFSVVICRCRVAWQTVLAPISPPIQ